jgi:hypothetical protein
MTGFPCTCYNPAMLGKRESTARAARGGRVASDHGDVESASRRWVLVCVLLQDPPRQRSAPALSRHRGHTGETGPREAYLP